MVGQEIYEFKSWSPLHRLDNEEEDAEQKYDPTKSQFWNFERGYSGFNQFVCYLQNVTTLDNLNYIFDQKLLQQNGQNIPFVKETFQNLFRNKASEIFAINPSLFNNSTINIPNAAVLQQLAEQGSLVNHPVLQFVKIK